jgi:glycolate oxidase iron-sulfur subunit
VGTPAAPTTSLEQRAYAASLDCVHCGLCTQQCPTYRITGDENHNPRGRIYLMRALLEGRALPGPDVVEALDSCLVCRACESVCPSGVRFAEIMTETRQRTRTRGVFRRFVMNHVLASPRRLDRIAGLVRLWQRSPVRALRGMLPARLRDVEALAPDIPDGDARAPLAQVSEPPGPARGTVALLEGCVMRIAFQDVNRATRDLLLAAGFRVVVPPGQTCCGALHEHDGDLAFARRLAERNLEAFRAAKPDALVTNSAGCAAALAGYPHLAGSSIGAPIVDLSRFLVEHGASLRFRGRGECVTYDAPCHLHHALRETTAPARLLRGLHGDGFVRMDLDDLCCGAAGVYNLDHPAMSRAVLAPKLDALARTGARVLVAPNPGCAMQWRRGIRERGIDVRVEHLATWLLDHLDPGQAPAR